MDDAELAGAAAAGDADAWAAIYDKYADRLHDFCWSVLRDQHEAADALHDAFITAADRIDQLRDPSRLRPWLYAICRTTCLQRARRRSKVVPTEDIGAMTPATFDDVTGGAEGTELRSLVWDAAGGLTPDDRALLDLHLRHGLDGAALGQALGTSAHAATVKLGRVRDLVERSLGALLVSRAGRRDCPELDGILGDWDGSLTPLVRKRVARHIETCAVCGERKRTMVNPLALLAAVPMVPAPADLRDRVLGDIQHISSTRGIASGRRQGVGRIVAAALLILAVIGVALVSRTDQRTEPTGVIASTTSSSSSTSSTSTTAPAVTRPRPATVTTSGPARTTTTLAPTTTTTQPPGRTTTTSTSTTTTSPRSPTGGP